MRDLFLLKKLQDRHIEDLEKLEEKYANKEYDKSGRLTSFRIGDFELLAIADYFLNGDSKGFKARLLENGKMRLELMNRYDSGESISSSYVTMLTYQELLSVLASGDIGFAKKFAAKMGGRGKVDTNIHPFDYKLAYCLKYLVLEDEEKTNEWLAQFEDQCKKKGYASYKGLVKILTGIVAPDSQLAQEGFNEFKKGYKVLTRKGSYNAHNEWLNLWGIGLANLALSRKLKLDINDEYIPKDLLIG